MPTEGDRPDGDRLDAAFAAVPRAAFLPPEQQGFAGENRALPIGHKQTNSQPSTVRDMLHLLEVAPGNRILDVGSGSGWTTTLLAHLTGPNGRVHGVERVAELVEVGRASLAAFGMTWADIRAAEPPALGLPGLAPYDRILVSAETPTLPEELADQLAVGGILVLPLAGRMAVVRREGDRSTLTHHGFYSFVPLIVSD